MTQSSLIVPLDSINSIHVQRVTDAFVREFNSPPSFVTRAPGRVNLIGEHIDYCGYSVLPMAVEQDILIACDADTESKRIRATNADAKYPPFECDLENVKIDASDPKWHNYLLCGYLGIKERFSLSDPVGMKLCVDGTIPPSAGLSSSSALVCAAALATLHVNGLDMNRKDLAALCARSEHFVGTEGGGMDQAISFLAEIGTAKLIEFNPLKTIDVQLPPGATFVIANSCSDANKAETSDYNTRVVECRIATQVLAKKNGCDWRKFKILSELQKELNLHLSEMATVVKTTLHKETYSRQEICDILEIADNELEKCSLNANTLHLKNFELYKRALHVFTEANRVWEFKRICDDQPNHALEKLGLLMNASHESCRDLYECSHPNLDEFVAIALKAGALGSRLTGAGWGGCTVSLVPTEKVNSFLKAAKEKFYAKSESRMQNLSGNLFPTQPGRGAAIFKIG